SLPLDGRGVPPGVDGGGDLRGVALGDARWNLELQRVRGLARYDRHGFRGEGLAAMHDRRASTLSLRASRGHVRDPGASFEAELDAELSTAELLEQAPRLAWLRPHMSGRSQWQVGVTVARSARPGAAATRLQLRSNLVGTALDLPEPLRKPAADTLPTTVTATLPLEDADVAVAMGNRLALRARSTRAGTGIRVLLGASAVPEPPPANGLVVGGRTPELDLLGWTALAGGDDGGGEDGGLALRGIDVAVGTLRLLGTRFPATRVQVSQDAALTSVRFDGETLAGALQVPRGPRGAVTGRSGRLHWLPAALLSPRPAAEGAQGSATAPGSAPGSAPGQTPSGPADAEIDPSQVPPVQLQVEDFRFGALALG